MGINTMDEFTDKIDLSKPLGVDVVGDDVKEMEESTAAGRDAIVLTQDQAILGGKLLASTVTKSLDAHAHSTGRSPIMRMRQYFRAGHLMILIAIGATVIGASVMIAMAPSQ